ncbi:hypothetical protein DWB63_12355 [Pseudodesulfovibrio sp. S3]|nr:hypothetical protein DWB63_12355 [Pseudodesulfovibrio sp. S3]
MRPTNSVLTILWWSIYTVLGIWAQRTLPGIDFFAPGIILSLQEEESGQRTALLGLIWILLVEGTGSLPFGYGLAWYGLLIAFYFMGRWLFEARSFLFMGLIGIGLGLLHPALVYGLSSLVNLQVNLKPIFIQGAMQAVAFPLIWTIADYFYPKRLRQDVKPL